MRVPVAKTNAEWSLVSSWRRKGDSGEKNSNFIAPFTTFRGKRSLGVQIVRERRLLKAPEWYGKVYQTRAYHWGFSREGSQRGISSYSQVY